jgi:hypothetical protein
MTLVVGCATHYTTSKPSGQVTPIYVMEDAQALALAHRALAEAFPSRKITSLEGPSWGFSTTYRILLDTYSQQVLVVPLEGTDPGGRRVRGFAFEVSGSGTAVISGSSKNRGLFKRIRRLADATGTRLLVANPTPVAFRPPGSGPVHAEEADIEQRLRRLRSLRDQGLINSEQFEAKQKEILDGL